MSINEVGNMPARLTAHDLSDMQTQPTQWRVDYRLAWPLQIVASILPLTAVLVSLSLWVLSIPQIDPAKISDIGLAPALPVQFFIGVTLLSISLSLAVYNRQTPAAVLLAHVVALIVIIHGTIPLIYEAPRYSWTYKHIGVTAYIMRYGSVDPLIDIYHNWPSFFTLTALFTEAAGIASPLSYALWAQLFFNLLYLGPLLMIFRALASDRTLVWLSVWFFFMTNWVGQDYYAPQAMSYFFYLVVLGACLTWFRLRVAPTEAEIRRWVPVALLASFVYTILTQADRENRIENAEKPATLVGVMAVIVLALGAIASMHQLTPLMTVASLTALVLFQRSKARSLPIIAAVLVAAWNAYVAIAFLSDTAYWLGSLFNLENISANVSDTSKLSTGQLFVVWVARGSSVMVWVLALFGWLRRVRRGKWDLSALVLAAVPFPMLLFQSYGGEMIFRIYLFSLPPMVFLNALLLRPEPERGPSRRAVLATVLLNGVLLAFLHFSYFGQEHLNRLTRDELEASQYVFRTAPRGSLIVAPSWNFPSKYIAEYDEYKHVWMLDIQEYSGTPFPVSDLEAVESLIQGSTARWDCPAAYLVISRSMKIQNHLRGYFPDGSIDQLEELVSRSEHFRLVYANPDARVFLYIGEAR